MCWLCMKQIQIKIIKDWEWLVMDNRAVKLVTVTPAMWPILAEQPRQRAEAVRLWDGSWAERVPACSFVAQQAAANMTAGLALSRATDCKASGDIRAALMWQNVLRYEEASCLLHYSKADCIALALVTTGHSLCGTTSHTENVQMRLVGPT